MRKEERRKALKTGGSLGTLEVEGSEAASPQTIMISLIA